MGTLDVTNSTFSGNSATDTGGGIYNAGTATLKNTIIANNPGGDCIGVLSGQNFNNLIKDTGANACDLTNGVDDNIIGVDPNLGTLTGLPGYLPLNPGSPAIDAGDNGICTNQPVNNQSQNGISRLQDGNGDWIFICDIGAYEYTSVATFLSLGTQDGWILESRENSNVGGTLNQRATTLRIGDDAARKQYRAILSFNTSRLPNAAVVTKVTLKLKEQEVVGGEDPVTIFQGFMADIRKGTFGTSTLELSDWRATAQSRVGPLSPALTDGWYILDLTAARMYINKLSTNSGLTQIRLRFNLDDNNDDIANHLSLYSGNADVASRPMLVIEYYVP